MVYWRHGGYCAHRLAIGEPGVLNTQGCSFKERNVKTCYQPRRPGAGVVNSRVSFGVAMQSRPHPILLLELIRSLSIYTTYLYGKCQLEWICRIHLYWRCHMLLPEFQCSHVEHFIVHSGVGYHQESLQENFQSFKMPTMSYSGSDSQSLNKYRLHSNVEGNHLSHPTSYYSASHGGYSDTPKDGTQNSDCMHVPRRKQTAVWNKKDNGYERNSTEGERLKKNWSQIWKWKSIIDQINSVERISKNGRGMGRTEYLEDKMEKAEQNLTKTKKKNKKTPMAIPIYIWHLEKAKFVRLSALKKQKNLILETWKVFSREPSRKKKSQI